MFYSIHKLNRSTISINDFSQHIYIFSPSQQPKNKRVQGGLTISGLIFGCDNPAYNSSPVGKSSLLT